MGQHHPREKSGDQELSPCPWWRIKLNWGVRQLIDYITGLGATKKSSMGGHDIMGLGTARLLQQNVT